MSQAEPAPPAGVPGAQFLAEIHEQPAALRRLLEHEDEVARAAALAIERDVRLIRLVGHGSSDNAASFGIYAFGLLPRWTAMRDCDHAHRPLRHAARHDRARQSSASRSPAARPMSSSTWPEHGPQARSRSPSRTTPLSELGDAAEVAIPLAAEPELAVAATKTYVNTLAVLALLAGHLAGGATRSRPASARASEQLEAVLPALERAAAGMALPFCLHGPDVRDRARRRVRDRPRDRAEAPRDVPDRRRAAHRDRPRAWPRRRARPALPRLGDRLARRDARAGAGGCSARPGHGRDARRERDGGVGARRRGVRAAGPIAGARRFSPPFSPSSPGSCSPGRSRARAASIRTRRTASPRSRWRADLACGREQLPVEALRLGSGRGAELLAEHDAQPIVDA